MNDSESNAIQEKRLVARAQDRDEPAFQELVRQYERRMLYYLHRLLGNHADLADIMQEIWIRVFLRIPTLRAPEAFRVWLYKIAHDVAVNQLRKNKRREIASLLTLTFSKYVYHLPRFTRVYPASELRIAKVGFGKRRRSHPHPGLPRWLRV